MFKSLFPAIFLSASLLAISALALRAEPLLAALGDRGKNQASVSQGNFKAVLTYQNGNVDGEMTKIPHLYVMHGNKTVITLKGTSSGSDWPQAEARIVEMDPSNPYPEVVFSTYSGGAHCCFNVLIATSSADGQSWKALNVGDYDGGFRLEDLDGDGRTEFLVKDQRFSYEFASYAGSVSPPLIYHLQGLKLDNMTKSAPFRPYLMRIITELDGRVTELSDRDERNGLLAGYVAIKGLVGDGEAAWGIMLKAYNRQATDGLTGCQAGYGADGKCKAPETRFPDFPKALEAFLRRTGYL